MTALNSDMTINERIRARLDRPIVLVGLMGVGKTRLGRMLASALDLPFRDSDNEVEKAAQMTISEIFERFGEEYFRDGEQRVIRRLLDKGVAVIATGGGAIMRGETEQAVREEALSIWVRAELPVMLERTSRNDRRPLLQTEDPEAVIRELIATRYPVYEKSDIIIDSHNGPAEAILNHMLQQIHDFLTGAVAERV